MVGTGPAELGFQAGAGLTQLAQQLRAAAEQQSQFQQEMRLRQGDQDLRTQEFANTQKQQGVQNQHQQYTDLATGLQNGWKPVAPGAPVPGPGAMVTPPGSSQQLYVPTQDENNAAATKQKGDEAKAVSDATSFSAPWLNTALENALKATPGSMSGASFPNNAVPDLITRLFQTPKTVNPHIDEHVTNDGTVTTRGFDQETGKKLWSNTETGIGPTRKDPDAQGNGGPKPPTNTQLNAVSNKMKVSLARAEANFKKAMGNAKVGGYTDTEAAGQALADLHKSKQDAQDTYEAELQQYGIPTQHVEYSEEKTGSDDTTKKGGDGDTAKQGKQRTQTATPATPVKPAAAAAPRQRAMNPKTKQIVEWNGKTWAPVTQ